MQEKNRKRAKIVKFLSAIKTSEIFFIFEIYSVEYKRGISSDLIKLFLISEEAIFK